MEMKNSKLIIRSKKCVLEKDLYEDSFHLRKFDGLKEIKASVKFCVIVLYSVY